MMIDIQEPGTVFIATFFVTYNFFLLIYQGMINIITY